MDNNLIPQAIEIVSKAIEADNNDEYEKALNLYRDALARFTVALKYEKNESRKKMLLERVEGYMNRAEELSNYLKKISENDFNSGKSGDTATKQKNDKEDDDTEKKKLRGALNSAIVTEKPNIKWGDVAGLHHAKESLKETVILPTKFPQLFTGNRRPFKGILLYGPPGTGKSYLAKAVATEADSTFFSISSSDLISKWQGESERLVRNLFEMARESPGGRAIIFIDEIDSLCGSRSEGESDSSRRVKTEFLVQMDGVGNSSGQVLVLGATNVPWELDAAIRRRFEKRVYIPLPDSEARSHMIKLHLGNEVPHNLNDKDFEKLGRKTLGASGSDIKVLVKEALMEPLRTCQQAKQFLLDAQGYYYPCLRYPNCPYCKKKSSSIRRDKDNSTCERCGALTMSIWGIPIANMLKAPKVEYFHFRNCLKHSCVTVSENELKRYTDWTEKFGQDGA